MKIILIGFMGAGKTTIAKRLSERLSFRLAEMDEWIVSRSDSSSVSAIFAEVGEEAFRRLETKVAHSLQDARETVISTGGGVVTSPEAMYWLAKGQSLVIWLSSSFATLALRVGKDLNRPLFADREQAERLFVSRLPLYEKYADVTVKTEGRDPEKIVEQIIGKLRSWVDTFPSLPAFFAQSSQSEKTTVSLSGKTQLCVIIGDPVSHSLSPTMHNAAYAASGMAGEYVYLAAHVKKGDLARAVDGMKSMHFRGLTCTIPHKVAILPFLDELSPAAASIGAVNTVVQQEGRLYGENTDWLGIVNPLKKRRAIIGKKVAVIGAGGTARAALYALQQEEVGDLFLFNRTLSKAECLADEFGCIPLSLDELPNIVPTCDVVIQTTSVGMAPLEGHSLLSADCFHSGQVVMEAIYTPFETRFLQEAKAQGAEIIRGAEMFLEQGIAQFQMYTGKSAPYEVMYSVVCSHFGVGSLC